MHFNLDQSVALTAFASAAFHIKTVPTRRISAHARFRQIGVQIANVSEQSSIRGGVRTRCPTDRRLMDVDDLVQRRYIVTIHASIDLRFFVIEELRERVE